MEQPNTDERAHQAAHERHREALWYAWGREDAGDRRLRDASTSRVLALTFADFAATEAQAYASERVSSLAPVHDQYERFVTALTIGTRRVNENTGDVIEVVAYDGNANHVHCRIIDGPHGVPSVPKGFTFVTNPAHLADRSYRPVRPDEQPAGDSTSEPAGR
jgi:hypothetical protein